MTGNEIRRRFLDYFRERGHQVVRSSPLVPQDDPTLLFINAGMVQFKRVFLGEERRDYVRAVSSQKCVRAGGKHNDLENVGYTARHHTFFEMLGNFSFGDYFKERAVEYAWDLLTRGFGLPAERLYASIYLDDEEAHDIWRRQVGLPGERIVRFGEKDNFWSMGDTGPCGPCSEIILDRGPAYGCGRPECTVGCDCDRFLEIWNLVFMQFNRAPDGTLTRLPRPSIDTGMGLERIAAVVQDVETNFDTDLLRPIIARAEDLSGVAYGSRPDADVAMKVIADHSRAAAFLIGDGVLPANEGRGYVLRRILRRAVRYGRHLGLKRPFLHETAAAVFAIMGEAYPELLQGAAAIAAVIRNEEERFRRTLDTGLNLLNDTLEGLAARGATVVPGEVIFRLYDTYGFPVDIVRDVTREKGLQLDLEGFEREMDAQRARSRSVASFHRIGDAYRRLSAEGFQPEFVGYDTLAAEGRVLLLVAGEREVEQVEAGGDVELVADRTPFYAESGGQVGDRGRIRGPSGEMEVTDTRRDPTGIVIHRGRVAAGVLRRGEAVRLEVDAEARAATARNHTATHLLHAALRQVLGEHVKQAGSLVAPDRLRFDFTHGAPVAPEELERVEQRVNEAIRRNLPAETADMDVEEALRSGAVALFEEKYGERVRVVTLAEVSRELCGGTHTARTGDIGFFQVLAESGVAAGVRRIEAVTGEAAVRRAQETARLLREAGRLLKEKPEALPERIARLLEELREAERTIARLEAKRSAAAAAEALAEAERIAGVAVVVRRVEADSPAALREMLDRFKERLGSGVCVLGSVAGGKALVAAGVTADLTGKFHAGRLVQEAAATVGGRGGGRPDMAQGGGPQAEHLERALARVRERIREAASS